MAPQFHETGYGHRFFEAQLPRLIKALEDLRAVAEPTTLVKVPLTDIFVNPRYVTKVEPLTRPGTRLWVVSTAGAGTSAVDTDAPMADVLAALNGGV